MQLIRNRARRKGVGGEQRDMGSRHVPRLSRLIWLPPLSTWRRMNSNSNSNACTQVSEAEARVAALETELSAAAQRLVQADGTARLHLREAERLERGAEAARVAAAEAGVRQGEAEAAAKRAEGDCANLRAKVAQTEAAVKVCVWGVCWEGGVGGNNMCCARKVWGKVRGGRQPCMRRRGLRLPPSINFLLSIPSPSIAR